MRAQAAISIDLDGARHYHAIHGLSPPERDVLVANGLARFLELCARYEVQATIFVVTKDLDDERVRELIARAHREGHEIASHSDAHRYDLSRQAQAAIEADLARSIDAIVDVTGSAPRGFRAPGYNQSEALMDAVEKLGFAYDSSFLASPLYFGARALAIGAIRARSVVTGSARSTALVGDLRESAARKPFRPRRTDRTQPARSRVEGRDLIEIPISGALGAPFIGTALVLAGPLHGALTALALAASGPCVLELHAMDLCDAEDMDVLLAHAQPEARIPLRKKRAILSDTFAALKRARDVVTLERIAAELTRV